MPHTFQLKIFVVNSGKKKKGKLQNIYHFAKDLRKPLNSLKVILIYTDVFSF